MIQILGCTLKTRGAQTACFSLVACGSWQVFKASSLFPLHTYLYAMKILMVCLGNICRSPLAEGILQEKVLHAGLPWIVDSAGTNGFHVGEHPHPLSIKVAKEHGIDISAQVARRFVREDLDRFDKIYAMAADVLEEIKNISAIGFDEQKVVLFLNELYPGKDMDVPDPWYGPEPGYHAVFELIDRTCTAIIEKYSMTRAS